MVLESDKLPIASNQRTLEEIARSELGTSDYKLTISAGSAKGDNYLGIVYRARAECLRTGRHLNIIVKLPPENEARRKQFFAQPAFEREILFYDGIYPMMEEFQREKGIPVEEGFHHIPRCFKTSLMEYEEAIFMGDLKDEGYDMFDRHQEQGVEHFRLVVTALARYHALSFALKDQHPERMKPFQGLQDFFTMRGRDEAMQKWFEVLVERVLEQLDEKEEPEVYARTKKALDGDFLDMIVDMTTGANAEPYAVICHGDCWNNNIMFKMENNTPVDIRLLDFQICRYASPVLDLMYFIFSASTKAFRDKHYTALLDLYHQTLSDFLRNLGSDPDLLFPRSALDGQLRRFGRFGLQMAAMILPVVTTNAEDVPNLEEMAERLENGEDLAAETKNFRSESTADVYRERMGGCCRDMVQYGYI